MTLKEKIDSFPFWYHKIDIGGEVTPGWAPLNADNYNIPDDLTGKRVLDVGAWDGYWTFEALKRGASQVVAIDDWSDMPYAKDAMITKKDYEKRTEWDTFDFCKSHLGYTDDQCQRYTMSVYDVEKLGMFDVVFFFGALYHCRYPLLALDKLSAVCKEEIYVETAVCDDYSAYTKTIGFGYGNMGNVVMEFYPTDELGYCPTNWWSPTMQCLRTMLASAGFNEIEIWKFMEPKVVAQCRGFAKGKK